MFRHTQEGATYTIAKSTRAGIPEYTVLAGRQRLRVARTLPEALDYFRPDLSLVPARFYLDDVRAPCPPIGPAACARIPRRV